MAVAVPTAKAKRTFAEHKRENALAKAKARCKICLLPKDLQTQIAEARELGGTSRELSDWLKDEFKRDLAIADFQTHSNGKHDLA